MDSLVGNMIEIEFNNGSIEKFKVVRIFRSNGDIKIDKKNENRIELVTKYNEYYLRTKKAINATNSEYLWFEAYLKGSKTHQNVRVKGCGKIDNNQ